MFKSLFTVLVALVSMTMSGCGGIYRGVCGDGRLGGAYELEFIASKTVVMNMVECINTNGNGYNDDDKSTDQTIKLTLGENDPHDYTEVNGWGVHFELVNESGELIQMTVNFNRPMALVQLEGDEYNIPIKGTEKVDNETISFDVPAGSSWWSIGPLY